VFRARGRVVAVGVGSVESFVSFDGISIAYRRWNGASDLPPVVLHHEFAANHALTWIATGVVEALLRVGRTVIAVDARGHGLSDKPHEPARYGARTLARDLSALVDDVKAESVDLVGYGFGSVVALITASQDVRVRRLVAAGVGAGAVEVGGVDTRGRDPRPLRSSRPTPAETCEVEKNSLVQALQAPDARGVADPGAREFRVYVDAVQGDRWALAAQLAALHDDPIPLRRITARTLVLAGSDDRLAARPEVLVHAIPKALGRFVAGDHLSTLGNPEFRERIVEFLQVV